VPSVLRSALGAPSGVRASRAARSTALLARSLFAFVAAACSSSRSESVLPYPVGQAMVFGAPEGGVLMPLDSSCESEVCLAVRERCGPDAFAEVIVDTSGAVLDVMCYPGHLSVREIQPDPFDRIGEESDTVFVFDAQDDGADMLGEVVVSGDDDVLYGAGAELSVLGDGLRIDGERVVVRGMTIRGDVTVDKNDAKLSLVQINGDLTINGNGVTLSESIVHGDLHLVGSGAVLSRNLLEGAASLSATNLACHQNQRFDDADADRFIDASELGGEIDCR
jgi:hypothetical protein